MTKINEVLKILNNYPISKLSRKELDLYIKYRITNLLPKKIFLVRREIEYLFGETGIGSRRIDPVILKSLLPDDTLSYKNADITLNIDNIKKEKKGIQFEIIKNLYSKKIIDGIVALLSNYLKTIKITQNSPLILTGTFNNTPVFVLFKNGEWVMPNEELTGFLNLANNSKALPIIISKRIHGIIFPLFKIISCVGVNIYYTFTDTKTTKKILALKKLASNNEYGLRIESIEYNELLAEIDDISKNIKDNYYDGDLLKNFFEKHLPKIIGAYYENFIKSNIDFNTDFKGLIKQLGKGKYKKNLLLWIKDRDKILIQNE